MERNPGREIQGHADPILFLRRCCHGNRNRNSEKQLGVALLREMRLFSRRAFLETRQTSAPSKPDPHILDLVGHTRDPE